MYIDKYKTKYGDYIKDGITYSNVTDLLATGFLGFCGCGMPEETLIFVKDVLQLISDIKTKLWTKKITYEEHKKLTKKILPNDEIEYFIYYTLSEKQLLEHGGGLPGWLTELGEQILSDLKEWELTIIKGD